MVWLQRELSRLFGAESGQLTTTELNSLIGHAHRRVDQLQRQLVEQSALEPLRMECALNEQRASDQRLSDEMITNERQHFTTEITKLHDAWVCLHCLRHRRVWYREPFLFAFC